MASPSSPASERPLRRDAERNRLRILQAAREVFADRGLDASLDQIAAHAGVGVGTVYRRFADKDALIDALFEERIDEVTAAGQRALSASDPWEGLVGFLQHVFIFRLCENSFFEKEIQNSPIIGRCGPG